MPLSVDPAAVLAALSHGVYVVDTERRITYWNAAAAEIAGYDAEQVLGARCRDGLLDHVDDEGRVLCGDRCPLLQTMVDGRDRTVRVYLHHRDGHLKPVQVSAAALRDADGTIVGAVETFSDETDFHATRSRATELERLSLLDPLTEIGNRRYLDECLDTHFADVGSGRCGLLMIDVDRFKRVNDTHGHDVGDEALRIIARTLSHGVRADDVVARFGGEEFVVVTETDDAEALVRLAERLRVLIRSSRIPTPSRRVRLTASIGAALALPGETPTALLRRADEGLLRAKREGRDRVVLG